MERYFLRANYRGVTVNGEDGTLLAEVVALSDEFCEVRSDHSRQKSLKRFGAKAV